MRTLTRLRHRLTAHHARQTTPTQRMLACPCGWKRRELRRLIGPGDKGGLPF